MPDTIKSITAGELTLAYQRAERAGTAAKVFGYGTVALGVLAIGTYVAFLFINPDSSWANITELAAGGCALGTLLGGAGYVASRVAKWYLLRNRTPENFAIALGYLPSQRNPSPRDSQTNPLIMKSLVLENSGDETTTPILQQMLSRIRGQDQELIAKMNHEEFKSFMAYLEGLVKRSENIDPILQKLAEVPEKVVSNLMFVKPHIFEQIHAKNSKKFDQLVAEKIDRLTIEFKKKDSTLWDRYIAITSAFGVSNSSAYTLAWLSHEDKMAVFNENLKRELADLFENLKKMESLTASVKTQISELRALLNLKQKETQPKPTGEVRLDLSLV